MSGYYVAGFCVGLFLVLFVFLIIRILNNNKTKTEYDERQILARNSAYKASYFTLMSYMALIALLDSFDFKWAEFDTQMLLGILISVTVFVTICIFKDAYFGYNEKSIKAFLPLAIVLGFMNVLAFVMNVVVGDEVLFENGLLTHNSTNLFIGILFIILFIVIIIKNVISKRTVEDEE